MMAFMAIKRLGTRDVPSRRERWGKSEITRKAAIWMDIFVKLLCSGRQRFLNMR